MDFEWDDEKAASNFRKPGISFAYAAGVFYDRYRFEESEPLAEYAEERWRTIGLVGKDELFVVSTMRGEKTRLISARRATRHERDEYWENRNLHL